MKIARLASGNSWPKWWVWILGTLSILLIWQLGTALVLFLSAVVFGEAPTTGWVVLLTTLLTFVPLFIATPLMWKLITKQPIRTLVTDSESINFKRIGFGFLAWGGILVFFSLLQFLVAPGSFAFTYSGRETLVLFGFALILLPIQTTAEELFFRGWVIQWARKLPMLVISLISGVVFMLPHLGNAEMETMPIAAMTSWFLAGAGFAYVSIRDGSIELAIGAHFANNIFAFCLVGYEDSSFDLPAIFIISNQNSIYDLISACLGMLIFITFTKWLPKQAN